MSKKKVTPTQRIERLESIVVGAGFLLRKLEARYGDDFGMGMAEQVAAFIRDSDQISRARVHRAAEAAKASGESAA